MPTQRAIVGRAKTVLVFGQGDAARAMISSVVARVCKRKKNKRMILTGPAVFDDQAIAHFHEIILPAVDQIVSQLGIRPKTFQMSVVNLNASATADLGLKISGFSADVAVMLALLSAALKLPLPQDVVVTGHIASPDCDIRSVMNIPAKLAAALEDLNIQEFVYPSLDVDTSMQNLASAEKQRVEKAIFDAKGRIRISEVADVGQVLEKCLADENIILGGLCSGFFELEMISEGEDGSISHCVKHLILNNDKRFWDVLESHLLHGRNTEAKMLLRTRAKYQIRRKAYPQNFGRQLLQLLRSLPPATRQLKTRFPMLAVDKCIAMAQFAAKDDQEDIPYLIIATSGSGVSAKKPVRDNHQSDISMPLHAMAALDKVLDEISQETLADKIGLPIDAARACYVIEDIIVDSLEIFDESIAAFYLHILRHTESIPSPVKHEKVAAEAISLTENAFRNEGGVVAARAEAKYAIHGGMLFVLNRMTDQYKSEQQAKHVSRIFKTALDSLDWDSRVQFMTVFLERLGPNLPPDIREQPPARFAYHYEPILRAYMHSMDSVKQVLQTL